MVCSKIRNLATDWVDVERAGPFLVLDWQLFLNLARDADDVHHRLNVSRRALEPQENPDPLWWSS